MTNMDPRTAAAFKQLAARTGTLQQTVDQLMALQKAATDAPKWIEQIPGRRVPFHGGIDLAIEANNTAKVEGNYTVTEDGQFVVAAIGAFFQKTSGDPATKGIWGYASAADGRLAAPANPLGYAGIFDQPHIISGDFTIVDRGSDRRWENRDISTALFSPQAGGVYVLPVSCLMPRNAVIEVGFTPSKAIPYTGKVQMVLLGYKIVQGSTYAP